MHPLFPVVVLFSVAVSGTTFYLKQNTIAYIELALGFALSVIVFLAELKNYGDLKKIVKTLNDSIINSGEDRISGIPLPFALCRSNGEVIWFNDLFEKMLSAKEL